MEQAALTAPPSRISTPAKVRRYLRRNYLPYLYLLPSMVVMLLIIVVPIGKAVVMSFQDYNFLQPVQLFVGLDNYTWLLFEDFDFWTIVRNTIVWTVSGVLLNYVLAMLVALLLNQKSLRFRQFFRGIVLVPWVIPTVVVALVFRTFFDPFFGLFNAALRGLGVIERNLNWLADPNLVMPSLIGVALWKYSPFFIIGLLAGLQAIPEELYDAAKVDGASVWQRFWHITFPQLLPISLVLVVLGTIWRANHFDLVWLLTGGGPGVRTMLIAPYAYRTAITDFAPGLAAAISLLGAVVLLCFVFFFVRRMVSERL
jgi:multiple sugar transport system permease protein